MLSLLGIGHAWPEIGITDDTLSKLLGADAVPVLAEGIRARRSVLPEEYIASTGNLDVEQGERSALCSPTDLSEQAAKLALERAGVDSDALGLLVAGGSTPRETTPSEAQRIGKRFGLKTSAYDIFSSSSDITLHLSVLSDWKEERIPEYVLSASSSCPTARVNYQSGIEPYLFGDGAAALIISSQHPGKLQLLDVAFVNDTSQADLFVIELYGHLKLSPQAVSEWIDPKTEELLRMALQKNSLTPQTTKFIGPQLSLASMDQICEKVGIPPENHWSNVSEVGCSLGAAPFTVLSEHWDKVLPGDTIVLCTAGIGLSAGYLVLKAREDT